MNVTVGVLCLLAGFAMLVAGYKGWPLMRLLAGHWGPDGGAGGGSGSVPGFPGYQRVPGSPNQVIPTNPNRPGGGTLA